MQFQAPYEVQVGWVGCRLQATRQRLKEMHQITIPGLMAPACPLTGRGGHRHWSGQADRQQPGQGLGRAWGTAYAHNS